MTISESIETAKTVGIVILLILVLNFTHRLDILESRVLQYHDIEIQYTESSTSKIIQAVNQSKNPQESGGGGEEGQLSCPAQDFDLHTQDWVSFIDTIGPKLQNEYPGMIQFFSYWIALHTPDADVSQYVPTNP